MVAASSISALLLAAHGPSDPSPAKYDEHQVEGDKDDHLGRGLRELPCRERAVDDVADQRAGAAGKKQCNGEVLGGVDQDPQPAVEEGRYQQAQVNGEEGADRTSATDELCLLQLTVYLQLGRVHEPRAEGGVPRREGQHHQRERSVERCANEHQEERDRGDDAGDGERQEG